MENFNAVWMEHHLNHVQFILMYTDYCLYKINTIGSSGDVFPNLSVGTHRMNVQFTPAGSCEAFALQPAINISIAAPTPAPTTRPSKMNYSIIQI